MKILTEEYENGLFNNYQLTDLMLLKKGGKENKIANNIAIHILLSEKLLQYGIQLFSQFKENELTFRSVMLLDDFPVENEPILKQLYGYINFVANIQLAGFENCSFAFDYNVSTGECELQKHYWGVLKNRRKYDKLSDMLADIKEKGYDNILE